MSIIIKPEIRKTSEIKHHHDNAPGDRYVFVDKKLYSESEFYVIGRKVEHVLENQQDYIDEHRHNCNSFYFFIGDNEDLTGLKAEVMIEGKKKIIESPVSVFIPEKILHTYKLIGGKGWFIHVVLNPDYDSSLFEGEAEQKEIDIGQIIRKFEKKTKKPTEEERPISKSDAIELKNPQRWVLVSPEIFQKTGIYSALHQIFPDKPFTLNQKLHTNYEDEVYLYFSTANKKLSVNMYSSEDEKQEISSPITVYHPKGDKHRYDYVGGEGFLMVILKERFPGEGYTYRKL